MARSCAAWDDNNKDNVCELNIPAGIKCPPPSKTISFITRLGPTQHVKRENPEKAYKEVFGLQTWDPVRQCFVINDGELGGVGQKG